MKNKVFLMVLAAVLFFATLYGGAYFLHTFGLKEWFSMPTVFLFACAILAEIYLFSHASVYGK